MAWSVLVDHVWAFLLLWGCIGLTGWTLARQLRLGVGMAGAALVAIVYWSLALYVFPFAGGLLVAAGIVLVLAGCNIFKNRPWVHSTPFLRFHRSRFVLLVGSLPFLSTLLTHYVPHGMDASMHTTAAVLIARSHGLPADYAPFLPEVPFPAVNLGLPTVAAVPIMCGADPASVMLAAHHVTFTCLILATFVLLRRVVGRTPAAVLAVACAWMARAIEASVGWGGFPTVMSIAVGVLAARLLLDHARRFGWRLSLATGAAVAAVPLVHGIGGGTWVYCVGPWVALWTLGKAGNRLAVLRRLAFSACWAGVFLLGYRLSGTLEVGAAEMERTREFVMENAPPAGVPWRVWTAAFRYVVRDSGTVLVALGLGSCLLLAWRRQWPSLCLLLGAWLSITTLVANSRWYVLPASFLLYPDRVIYWTAPLSAVGLALAWRHGLSPSLRQRIGVPLALALLVVAGYFHNQFYQRTVREDYLDRDGWEAIQWAKQHLDSSKDLVSSPYNEAASFLPALAQVACTGSHNHHFINGKMKEVFRQRTSTHQMTIGRISVSGPIAGKTVFANRSITIVELPRSRYAASGVGR